MPVMVIVADDLSGAADCGVACVESGLETVVLFGKTTTKDAQVVCIDTDSRRMTEADAAHETARAFRDHTGPGVLLYKKMDSTLRGHVGAEIAAALGVARAQHSGALAIVAPAFPATGRITRGASQYLGGVPVEETEIWRGMKARAHLPDMLAAHGLTTAHCDLASVRSPSGLVHAMVQARDADALVCDAESEDDLASIARAGAGTGSGLLWLGSGGLSKHLPEAYGFARPRHARTPLPSLQGPLLFVVGSLSRVSREQVERLTAGADVALVSVSPAILRNGPGSRDWAREAARLAAAFAAGRDTVLVPGPEESGADGSLLCPALAVLLVPHAVRCGGLFLTGGETARAVLRAFGTDVLRLEGEIEPGVTLSMAQGALAGGFGVRPVVIKSGGFGTPDTMSRCRDILRAGLAI